MAVMNGERCWAPFILLAQPFFPFGLSRTYAQICASICKDLWKKLCPAPLFAFWKTRVKLTIPQQSAAGMWVSNTRLPLTHYVSLNTLLNPPVLTYKTGITRVLLDRIVMRLWWQNTHKNWTSWLAYIKYLLNINCQSQYYYRLDACWMDCEPSIRWNTIQIFKESGRFMQTDMERVPSC